MNDKKDTDDMTDEEFFAQLFDGWQGETHEIEDVAKESD